MSFGVPEAIEAIKFLIDVGTKIKNASSAIQNIQQDIRRVKDHLELVHSRLKNPKSPLGQADAKIKSMLEDDSMDIRKGCKQAAEYFDERKRMHWFEWGSKYLWISNRIPALQDILRDFEKSTASIDKKISLLIADAQERADAKKDASDAKAEKRAAERQKKLEAKLDKMAKAHEEERKARKEEARNSELLAELLKVLTKESLQDVADGKGEGKKCAEGVVNELVKSGMKRSDAKSKLEDTLKVVRSERVTQKSTIKRAATDEVMKVKPEVAKKPEKEPSGNNSWILCVDEENGPRSIIAQTYLEFIRVWTLNTRKQKLFERVDSAGAHLPTAFSAPTLTSLSQISNRSSPESLKAALATIAGNNTYFQTPDSPDEKGTILARIQEHQPLGLSLNDFAKFKHIICFGNSTHRTLLALLEEAKKSNKDIKTNIHHIPVCDWFVSSSNLVPVQADLLKVNGQIKVALKSLLKKEFGWEKPAPGIADGEWRTALVEVGKDVRDKLREDGGKLRNRVWEKKNVRVYVALVGSGKWLLSISGPRGKVGEARKMIGC